MPPGGQQLRIFARSFTNQIRGYFDFFLPYYFTLNVSYITEHLITGSLGNSFLPSNLEAFHDFVSGNIEILKGPMKRIMSVTLVFPNNSINK